MISFTVRLTFGGREREVVAELLARLAPLSRQEPGCVTYLPHFVEGEPCTVLIYEQYRDEKALDHHRGTEHFHRYATEGLYRRQHQRHVENLAEIA